MNTKTWILLFSILAVLCLLSSFFLLRNQEPQDHAMITSDGIEIMELDLSVDGTYTIPYGEEWNVVTVRNGKIAVTSASCSSQDCVKHGYSNSGAPIVCLPNRMVITFTAQKTHDAMVG